MIPRPDLPTKQYAVVLDDMKDAWQLRGDLWCTTETVPMTPEKLMRKYGPFIWLVPEEEKSW